MPWPRGTGLVIRATGATYASLAILFFVAAGDAADGASTQAVARTVWDGVYSVPQASRGRAVYESQCQRCHQPDLNGTDEASSLVGEAFMQAWREDTVWRLFTRVRDLMPFDDAGSLSEADYLDSVAYLLEANGFPPGNRDVSPGELADIRIVEEDGPNEVPSFAMVRVVGCLVATDDGGWQLLQSSAAVRTDDPTVSSNGVLSALAAEPLGTRTFDLMSVYPDPSRYDGHRMEAKGFLIRDEQGDQINVSTLGVVAQNCSNR